MRHPLLFLCACLGVLYVDVSAQPAVQAERTAAAAQCDFTASTPAELSAVANVQVEDFLRVCLVGSARCETVRSVHAYVLRAHCFTTPAVL